MNTLIFKGHRSEQVADVQARLRGLGMAIADEAGHFGDGTARAVQTFQQQRGVIVDGIVGPNTWTELVEASWRLGDRPLYLRRPLLRGDDIQTLQTRLNALGFDAGREDGIFGPDTDRAVRSFQKEYGVFEDGIFGPGTNDALRGLRIDRQSTAAGLREELRLAESGGMGRSLVVVDPGHGGTDPGFVSPRGLIEADLCWDLARRLAVRLAPLGARVRFTRTEANGPEVSDRARMANNLHADLVVSIHLNSHDQPAAEGASTYHFRTSRAGELLAEQIQLELVTLGHRDCRTHPRSYALLRETRMPAVLVEAGFLSNPGEELLFADGGHRAAIAAALARGIRNYFGVRVGHPAAAGATRG